jgi:broad specificity phosphatase PhoE
MLIVVRHAEAGIKGSWDGPDLRRPLSAEGRDQAEGLVVRLDDYPVERILSSPATRCLQTVEPLARDRLLQVEEVAALGVDATRPWWSRSSCTGRPPTPCSAPTAS